MNRASPLIQSQARPFGPHVARDVAYSDGSLVIGHWSLGGRTSTLHCGNQLPPPKIRVVLQRPAIQRPKFKIQHQSRRTVPRNFSFLISHFSFLIQTAPTGRPKILHSQFSTLHSFGSRLAHFQNSRSGWIRPSKDSPRRICRARCRAIRGAKTNPRPPSPLRIQRFS